MSTLCGPDCKVTEGTYDDPAEVIRSLAIALKFKVITVLLYPDKNETNVHLSFKAKIGDNDALKEVLLSYRLQTLFNR
jgi:hypothetical protein